jgi:signal transduction histidine kinase
VLDPAGIMLVNVAFPDLEGTSVAAMQDANGKFIMQEMLEVPEGESAWVDYMWPKPGDTRPSKKSSFIRRVTIDGQEYIVAGGVYFK